MSKILALLVACVVINSAYTAAYSSLKANYCQGVDKDGFCSSCYRHIGAKETPKQWSVTGNASATRVCTTAHFQTCANSMEFNSSTFGQTTCTSAYCVTQCKAGHRMNTTKSTTTSTWTPQCLKEANTIANCAPGKEAKTTDGATVTTFCGQCDKGYMPATYTAQTIRTCAKVATATANCEYYTTTDFVASPLVQKCALCKSGFIMTATSAGVISCTASAIKGCASNTYAATAVPITNCEYCRSAYYHDGINCTLASNLMRIGLVGALAMIAALFA